MHQQHPWPRFASWFNVRRAGMLVLAISFAVLVGTVIEGKRCELEAFVACQELYEDKLLQTQASMPWHECGMSPEAKLQNQERREVARRRAHEAARALEPDQLAACRLEHEVLCLEGPR